MTKMTKPAIYLTERFQAAMAYATEQHKDQSRKSTTITYICHPFGVASLVLEAGGDEDQAIAALLHDVPEDCGGEPRLKEIAVKFGARVEKIVRGCSDSLVEDPEEKAPWKERKEVHINHLYDADLDTLTVTAADKAHNARSIATDLQNQGPSLWNRFNANRADIIWYYDSVYKVLESKRVSLALLTPLRNAIDIMKTTGAP
jgi:(p)ppGpp synthase/HD superfamily hydrolase